MKQCCHKIVSIALSFLLMFPSTAKADCDSWVKMETYGPTCLYQGYEKSITWVGDSYTATEKWLVYVYSKNRNLCSEDEFFISEATIVFGSMSLGIGGIIGVTAAKGFLIPKTPLVYNAIHNTICGEPLHKSDEEIILQVNTMIGGMIDSIVEEFP